MYCLLYIFYFQLCIIASMMFTKKEKNVHGKKFESCDIFAICGERGGVSTSPVDIDNTARKTSYFVHECFAWVLCLCACA